ESNRILALFDSFGEGRIAFENNPADFQECYVRAGLSHALSDERFELLNSSHGETGDNEVHCEFVQHLNAGASQADFKRACIRGGVRYVVAWTNPFRTMLAHAGLREIGSIQNVRFSPYPNGRMKALDLSVFENDWA